MKNFRNLRVGVGIALWGVAVTVLLGWWFAGPHDFDRERLRRQLWQYVSGERQRYAWQAEQPLPVRVGLPVFVVDDDGEPRQVGEVTALPQPYPAAADPVAKRGSPDAPAADQSAHAKSSAAPAPVAAPVPGRLLLYGTAPPVGAQARLTFHETPHSMEWVLRTLLPPEKQQRISRELATAFEAHHEEILAALRPVVEDALRETLPVVEQQLAAALRRHDEELRQLGEKYQREIVEQELIPLVREEVWPIVYRQAEPTAREIGREIWEKSSLWRFGWRYAYDLSPLPEKKLLEQEWNRYLREDVSPVVEAHMDDIIEVQQRILADVARNERVREALRESAGQLVQDPQVQRLVGDVLREVLVDNPEVREVLREHWQSPQARRAFQVAAERLEPTVVRIGEMLLGTPREGITPEFARVLRNRVLRKDRSWIVLHVSGDSAEEAPSVLPLTRGAEDAVYPFVGRPGAAAQGDRAGREARGGP